MSTTTIRLPEALRARVRALAEARGVSAHALILEAVEEKADIEERRVAFLDLAESRLAGVAETGETINWDDLRRHIRAQAHGNSE